jgi:hypothetical protein
MIRPLVWIALASLVAMPASAIGGWYRNAAGTGSTVSGLSKQEPFAFFVFDSDDGTGFSKVLNLNIAQAECRPYVTIHRNTSGAGGTAEFRFWASTAAPGTSVTSSDGLVRISTDTDGDGVQDDVELDGETVNERHVWNVPVAGLVVEVVTAAGSGDTPVVEVLCR